MTNPWEEISLDDYEKHMSLDFKNCLMHKVFGTKENAEYVDREGAYLIPIKSGQIGVVKTPKGFFFLGGCSSVRLEQFVAAALPRTRT